VPREFTEGPENRQDSEHEEVEEHPEVDELEQSAREIIREAAEEAERLKQEEQPLKEVINELEEIEATEEEAKEVLEDTIRELQGLEEDLGYKIDEVREELHDEFVNDMESKLEGPSLKESQSDLDEVGESGEREETPGSGEAYIDGGDGTMYVMETGGSSPAEVSSESEIEEHTQGETIENSEDREESPEKNEVSASSEFRNSIIKTDTHEETEADEVDESASERRETSPSVETDDEHYTAESDAENPKTETREQESVMEHENVEKFIEDEHEETSEVPETEILHESQVSEERFPERELDELHEEEAVSSSLKEELEVIDDSKELVDADTDIENSDDAPEDNESEVSAESEAPSEIEVYELPDDVPEELVRKIEELLEELESLEEEDVDESRVIVEAMTGRKHIDRSLDPRPYFSESLEDLEQKKRERVREKVATLFAKLSEAERKKFKNLVRARLKNEEDLDAWLRVHPLLRASPDFKQMYEDAKKYLKSKKTGRVPSLISDLWKAEVERALTQLITTIVQRRARGLPMSRAVDKEVSKEWTQERLNELLSKHKHLTKHVKFNVRYRNAVSWIVLMQRLRDGEMQAEPSIEVLKELSKEFMITLPTARKWLKGTEKPMLVIQLERLLGTRRTPGGWRMPLVDSKSTPNEIITEEFRSIVPSEQTLIGQVKELLKVLISSSRHSVWFTEFSSESVQVLTYLKENKEYLEKSLSNSENRISLAMFSNRLFVYRQKLDQFSWTQMLEDELFYIDRKWKREVLGQVLGKMKLRNLKELSSIIRDLTSYKEGISVPVGGINADLQSRPNYLTGRTLGFALDVMNLKVGQVKKNITAIGKSYGKNWQIRFPRFPEGLELLEILARLYAIVASDGHIDKDSFRLLYHEKNLVRKTRVRSMLARLGDVWIHELNDPERTDMLQMPSVLGRLLHKFGIPVGDKVLQSISVPSFILNGPLEVQSAYLQELIPEEGAVTYGVYGGLKILWGRSVVLHEERVAKEYAGQKHLSRDMVQFVKKYGRFEAKRNCYRLSAGRLRSLKKSKDPIIARLASELDKIARSNKNKLQLDEQKLCRMMGIQTGCHLCYVRYYSRSGRVSAHWEAHTRSQKDVKVWWKMAPPNDERKRGRLDRFFSDLEKDE